MRASRKDRMRPFEVLGLAVIVGVFTGIVVILSTRNLTLAAIWLGVSFIAMLVLSATVVLMIQPRKRSSPTSKSSQPQRRQRRQRTRQPRVQRRSP